MGSRIHFDFALAAPHPSEEKARQSAKTEIEKLAELPGVAMDVDAGANGKPHAVHPTLTCKDALQHVAKIIHKVRGFRHPLPVRSPAPVC